MLGIHKTTQHGKDKFCSVSRCNQERSLPKPAKETRSDRQTDRKTRGYCPSSRTLLSPLPCLVDAGDGGLATPVLIGLTCPSVRGGDGASDEDGAGFESGSGAESGAGSSMKPRQRRQPSKSIRACMQPHSVTFC